MRTTIPIMHDIWAKSAGESLAEHTSNVLSVLAQIRNRSPYLSRLAEERRLWHRAFWACFLHDFGKAAKSFQAFLRGQAPRWRHRHEILSLAFVSAIQFDKKDFPWIVAGIAAHHKDAKEIIEGRYDLLLEPEDLALDELIDEVDEETVRCLVGWLRVAPKQWIKEHGFHGVYLFDVSPTFSSKDLISMIPVSIFSGLQSYNVLLRDLEKEVYTSPQNRAAILLRGLVMQADHLASAKAPELDVVSFPDRTELSARLGITETELRSHQLKASSVTGSLVLSAPTGSGKTEAALLWANAQQTNSRAKRHLIYILPYQASLNAMRTRMEKIIGREVALLHGRSLQALYKELQDKGYGKKESEIAAKRSNELAKLYQPPVWCTTPYQLLRAAYRLPGYEALWTAMAGALAVIDEIHAYEPAKLGMFVALLSELRERWGLDICIMTATMPTWLKDILVSLAGQELSCDSELFAAFQRHRVQVIKGNIFSQHVQKLIEEEVLSGLSVLVGVNTVRTAQNVSKILEGRLGRNGVILIHSRFTARDRLNKEMEIMARLGAGGEPQEPIAVVATQVIEVSLDLDFDTIITEPAPLEALIQRFGRVNRQGKKGIVPVRVVTRSIDDEAVYEQYLVSRAVDVLRSNNDLTIDELKVSKWLDEIYVGLGDRFSSEVIRHREEFRASCLQTLRAFESSPDLAERFDELFDNTEVLPKGLVGEFEQIYDESVIEAKSLLVPISWRQLCRNDSRVEWNKRWSVRILDRPYDSERGLIL